jgi:hypothetical protein
MIWRKEVFHWRMMIAILLGMCIAVGSVATSQAGSKEPVNIAAANRDYGDAPEGALAYPSSGILGQFPTCVGVGPASWIEHNGRSLYFGHAVDFESDGNGGHCPSFDPSTYDQDEGFGDGDAGLIRPRSYSIHSVAGVPTVYPLATTGLESMGSTCLTYGWGVTLDIEVHNQRSDGQSGYVNVLADWNQDGTWGGSSACPTGGSASEHILVNFPIPAGYSGPLSDLVPPNFHVGPNPGYVWFRFSITDRQVPTEWSGDGIFDDGETEDYLLQIYQAPPRCNWEYGDSHKMHWAQLPDLSSTGVDVSLANTSLADDFRCTQSGPITSIHFWGSFVNGVLPEFGPDDVTFTINIYSNDASTNKPGQLLWSRKVEALDYDVHQMTMSGPQDWYDPITKLYEDDDHGRAFQYDICFDEDEDLFVQRAGTIYWLEIQVVPDVTDPYLFGWKASQRGLRYNQSAMYYHPTFGWLSLSYPDLHSYAGEPMDLAFVIVGPETPTADTDYGDAPDPPYPTVKAANGAAHTIDGKVFLGRSVDAELDGQPNATATGDDNDGNNDDDGVVFVSDLTPGQKATVQVTASTTGVLSAWIDFNADGDWDDAGEQVFTDQTLVTGVNTLAIDVPAYATPGQTFSRWRFSTVRGLRYTGLAANGEVEDYMVTITGGSVPQPPAGEHVKWSQPPVEQDPWAVSPVYCGWDEPSYVTRAREADMATWTLVADDFRCVGNCPVTSVHWWGSYQDWRSDRAPSIVPQSWRIAFWSNVQADSRYAFSHPGQLLWVVTVPESRVDERLAGSDEFPRASSDTCFRYFVQLRADEYFQQSDFLDSTTDSTFWVSITAVYTGTPGPDYAWGWKTRPKPWMDGAVKFEMRQTDLRLGLAADPATVQLLSNALVCERLDAYDMSFELDTDPAYVKWEQAFTGLRDWEHYEDEQSMATGASDETTKWSQDADSTVEGMDVDATSDTPQTWPAEIAADDFQCTTSGPITRITVWGSWYNDIPPSNDAENVTFTLSIRQDIPASESATRYSMPGRILWQKQFPRGTFTVQSQQSQTQGYYSPTNQSYNSTNHRAIYRYVFDIDSKDAFQQTGSSTRPAVYWLSVQARVVHGAGSVATRFGWKTSANHWNDSAVWARAVEPFEGTWQELDYPTLHTYAGRPVDLAFAIETQREGTGLTYQRIVADDWQCSGMTPITSIVWWGSYIGYGYQACDCEQMTAPRQPNAFLLSIWTNVPDSDPADPRSFSHPGQKIWEYEATAFDEVLVGFDKHPETGDAARIGFEPVYRYTVRLPQSQWFTQRSETDVYWLSIAAVYDDPKSVVYPWGWTNHAYAPWGVPTTDLLAYYKLDESSGTLAADSSGNGNDGTVLGNPVWQPAGGQVGGALDLDGRGDYVKVEKTKNLNFAPGSFSVSAWVNAREVGGRWQALVEYDRTSTYGNRFGLWIDANGRFHFRVGLNTWQSTETLKAGAWYLLTATYDGTAHLMRLYINGMLDGTATNTSGYTTPVTAKLTLGVRGSEDSEFLNGLLDDVRIYGSTLSAEDILSLLGASANDNAVVGGLDPSSATWQWAELLDQTGHDEDLSFMLFTEPLETKSSVDSSSQGTVKSDGMQK